MQTFLLNLVLCCCVIGCSPPIAQRPSIQKYTPAQEGRPVLFSTTSNVDIFDLRPDENSILFDGRTYQVSIDIAMATGVPLDSEYVVEAIFSNVSSGLFSLREINQGGAGMDVLARLMWSVPFYGNEKRIQVNLYRALHSDSGRTQFSTREKSILRLYEVRCDPDSFFIFHFLRRVFSACHD